MSDVVCLLFDSPDEYIRPKTYTNINIDLDDDDDDDECFYMNDVLYILI